MDCAARPEAPRPREASEVSTRGTCQVCERDAGAEGLSYDIDGLPACESCAMRADGRSRAWGSAVLALVALGYLATLAVSYLAFHARPFVGGIAAIVAMVLGRVLQIFMRIGRVRRAGAGR